jgi:type I restriction enzyme S subunit
MKNNIPYQEVTNKKKFKNSEIGMIPKEWKVVELGKVAQDFISGGTPLTKNVGYWDGNIPWMTSANIKGKSICNGIKYITEDGLNNSATNIVPKNSILVASRVGIGKIAINLVDIAISQDLTGIVLNTRQIDVDFLYWLLSNYAARLKTMAQGSTIKGLLRNELEKFKIPLPPLSEQQKIAEILDTVDEAIEKVDGAIKKTERLKKGLMQELLTGSLRVVESRESEESEGRLSLRVGESKEFKNTKIGRIPKEWEVTSLQQAFTMEYGEGLTQRERIEGTYPVMGSNGVVGYHNQFLVQGPGVVIGRKGSIGAVTWIDSDFWPIDTTYYIKLEDKNIDLKWLYYKLTMINLVKLNMATGVPGLNRTLVYLLKIALPQLNEQKQITTIIDTVDERLQLYIQKKQKFEKIKKGLMNDLLTGRKRVNISHTTNSSLMIGESSSNNSSPLTGEDKGGGG